MVVLVLMSKFSMQCGNCGHMKRLRRIFLLREAEELKLKDCRCENSAQYNKKKTNIKLKLLFLKSYERHVKLN